MKVHFNEQVDTLCIHLDESEIVESEEVYSDVILDFDNHDRAPVKP
ncbi:MAG: hypothetical protein C4288_21880 [Leptolyngbya sp. ERB_1_1]